MRRPDQLAILDGRLGVRLVPGATILSVTVSTLVIIWHVFGGLTLSADTTGANIRNSRYNTGAEGGNRASSSQAATRIAQAAAGDFAGASNATSGIVQVLLTELLFEAAATPDVIATVGGGEGENASVSISVQCYRSIASTMEGFNLTEAPNPPLQPVFRERLIELPVFEDGMLNDLDRASSVRRSAALG